MKSARHILRQGITSSSPIYRFYKDFLIKKYGRSYVFGMDYVFSCILDDYFKKLNEKNKYSGQDL